MAYTTLEPTGPGRDQVTQRVLGYELAGHGLIILLIWFNELLDIPWLFLGAEKTPVNWRESILESLLVGVVAAVVYGFSRRIMKRMAYLEGILPVCASCKKIRVGDGAWQPIEAYVRDHSEADFSHSICPDCAARLYPDYHFPKAIG